MKSKYLIFVLVFGLLAFTACSSNYIEKENIDSQIEDINEDRDITDSPVVLNSGNYQVSPASSQMTWEGSRIIGTDHSGKIDVKSGSLQIVDGQLNGGEFIIDVTSLRSDEKIDALETHLKGEDFFNVTNYPEAKLMIINVSPLEASGYYQVQADLNIKDITSPINFITQLSQVGNILKAEAEFSIDRTTWDLKYGSGQFFQDLGDQAIKDEIEFEVELQASLIN